MSDVSREPLNYSSYLRLDELLALQTCASEGPEHDETLFIVIHQVYELWFKQILHEIDHMQTLFAASELARVQHTFKRVLTVLKVLVTQVDILETMTPLEFLSFRDRLESGSGFQSMQFRALEFTLGLKRRSAVDHYPEGTAARAELERRLALPTLWDSFLRFVAQRGYAVPESQLARDVSQPVESNDELQKVLIDAYRNDIAVRDMCERMVDLDEGVQEWRYRHVKMVERTIGFRKGTGGSAGAQYLRETLFRHAFPDLWEIRTEL
ncbi:MAG TPA: tryptophan 2,3-dioxygenase family protein [Longimicrobiales bacterium]